MLTRHFRKPYGFLLLQFIMDCRVKPGNDRKKRRGMTKV
jgi:hypothetical protein